MSFETVKLYRPFSLVQLSNTSLSTSGQVAADYVLGRVCVPVCAQ